jgi:hypothetical protein
MAGGPAYSESFSKAWAEACARVLGGAFDRSFRIVLGVAYGVGAAFLAHRAGGLSAGSLATGLVAAALFIAMPLVTIFAYVLGLSFLADLNGVPDDADPPMRTVFAAFAMALVAGVTFVGGAFSLPAVGAQLRMIFS